MPRKAPSQVIEHRLSLSNFERAQLEEMIDAYRKDKFAENIPNYMLGAAGIAVAGAGVVAAYALWIFVNNLPIDEAKTLFGNMGSTLFGDGWSYFFATQ